MDNNYLATQINTYDLKLHSTIIKTLPVELRFEVIPTKVSNRLISLDYIEGV
jgi:hypothetical protein